MWLWQKISSTKDPRISLIQISQIYLNVFKRIFPTNIVKSNIIFIKYKLNVIFIKCIFQSQVSYLLLTNYIALLLILLIYMKTLTLQLHAFLNWENKNKMKRMKNRDIYIIYFDLLFLINQHKIMAVISRKSFAIVIKFFNPMVHIFILNEKLKIRINRIKKS